MVNIYRLFIGISLSMFLIGCSGSGPSPSGGSSKNMVYHSEWKQPTNKKQPCQMLMEGYGKKGEQNNNYTVTWDGSCANGKAQGLGKLTSYGVYGSGYEIGYVVNGVSQDHFYSKDLDTKRISYGKYLRKNGKMFERYILVAQGSPKNVFMAGKGLESKNEFFGVLLQKNGAEVHKYAGMFGEEGLFMGGAEFIKNNKVYGKWLGSTIIGNMKYYSVGRYQDNRGSRYIHYKAGLQQRSKVPNSVLTSAQQFETFAYAEAKVANNEGQLALRMKKKYDSLHRKRVKPSKKVKKTKKRKTSGPTSFQKSMQSVTF